MSSFAFPFWKPCRSTLRRPKSSFRTGFSTWSRTRPGGRLQAADIVLARPVSARLKQDVSLWTGCIAGGLLADELVALVTDAGFSDVELVQGADVFAGAPQQSSAADFGTRGVGIRARR
jgi:hypothetical protein